MRSWREGRNGPREQKNHGEKEETGRTESTVRTWRTREQKILEREETGRTTPFVRAVRVNVARNVRNDIAACIPYDCRLSLERSKVTGCLRILVIIICELASEPRLRN